MSDVAASVDSGASTGAESVGSQSNASVGESRQVSPPANDNGSAESKSSAPRSGKPANDNGQSEAALKRKVRRMGEEAELDVDTAYKMLSDDFEHEFVGPGGKPMKARWADLVRAKQYEAGVEQRLKRAAEAEKRNLTFLDDGRKNPIEFLEMHLGIDDAEEWAMQLARQRYDRDMQLQTLLQSKNPQDHLRFQQEMRQLERERLERRDRATKSQQEREMKAQREQQMRGERDRIMRQEFESLGVPFSRDTMELAETIYSRYRNADVMLQPRELAAEVQKQWRNDRRSWLGGLPLEQLAELMGDELRGKLRDYETTSVKEQRKEQRQQAREESPAPRPQPRKDTGLSDRDFRRKYGS